MDFESGLRWLAMGLTIPRHEIERRFLAGWALSQQLGRWDEWIRPDGARQPAETHMSHLAA